jgi:hypothetical protein
MLSMGKILAIMLWLLGAAVTAAVSAAWMFAAEDGKLNAFALVALMWSVALGAGFVHHVKESGLLQRYRLGSSPLAGQPLGAMMPQ